MRYALRSNRMLSRSERNGSDSLPGGNSVLVPPDPISNSEVKRHSADDSVGSPHVKVGHCQVFTAKPRIRNGPGFFYVLCSVLVNQ